MYIDSFAKINFTLEILGKLNNEFHSISSLMHTVDLHDEISINNSKILNIETSQNTIKLEENIIYKTILLVKNEFSVKKWVDVVIKKNIPLSAGLGGGSSNAAATLLSLNKLWKLKMNDNKLIEMGALLGSDVPFFIKGGTQIGEGIGEKLISLKSAIKGWYLIITPSVSIDTKWAYSQLKNMLDSDIHPTKFSSSVSGGIINLDTLKFFENDFESVVFPTYPEIGAIKKERFALGAKFASLSGSGSTVFGIFDDNVKVKKAFSHFSPMHKTYIAHSL